MKHWIAVVFAALTLGAGPVGGTYIRSYLAPSFAGSLEAVDVQQHQPECMLAYAQSPVPSEMTIAEACAPP